MAKVIYKNGVTSVILRVVLYDSTSTTGGRKTTLTNASSGLIISTIADNEASATAYTSAGATIDTITTLGTFAAPTAGHCRFKEVDATNHPGLYEIQIADARWAVSNARSIVITTQCTGAVAVDAEVQLSAMDLNDGVHGGMTALPNAAAAAANGLLTFGSGTGQINPSGGKVPATLAATDVTGNVAADVQTIKTQTVTCGAGVTVGAFVGNATAALSVDASGRIDLGKWIGVAPLALSSQQVQAVVPSSTVVASVTGAVGSVTGNVGGSVVGDVQGKVLGGGASALTGVGVQADLQTIKAQAITCAAGVTILANVGFAAAPGAASGGLIAGSNAATTIAGLTLAGVNASGSTPATAGLTVTGGAASTTAGGTAADAADFTGGAGAATTNTTGGDGLNAVGGAAGGTGNTSGDGFYVSAGANGNGDGFFAAGVGAGLGIGAKAGATGLAGVQIRGGATSGPGVLITTTSGDGIDITPTAGHGIAITANGTSKHGAVITGGTAGTSDGLHCVAGTGGVDIRGNLTGNITGNLSGTVTTVTTLTNLPAIPNNWLTAAGIAASALNGKGDWLLATSAPTNFSSMAITVGGALTVGTLSAGVITATSIAAAALNGKGDWLVSSNARIAKNTALNNFPFMIVLSSDHVSPATGKTVSAFRSIDGGAFAACNTATATELSNGIYTINLAASDLNGTTITLRFTATGCDDTFITVVTEGP